jgi:hypothetical protein
MLPVCCACLLHACLLLIRELPIMRLLLVRELRTITAEV